MSRIPRISPLLPTCVLSAVLAAGCASDDAGQRTEPSPGAVQDWYSHTWIAPQPSNSVLHYHVPPDGSPSVQNTAPNAQQKPAESKGWFRGMFDGDWDLWPFDDKKEADLTNQPQVLAPDPF